MKGVKIRELNGQFKKHQFNDLSVSTYSRYDEFLSIFLNNISIKAVGIHPPMAFDVEEFVKHALVENGVVGYDKIVDKFYYVYGEGINELGNPKKLIFVDANGHTLYQRQASYDDNEDGAYYIKAMPSAFSIGDMIKHTTDFMDACDVAINQNLEACKTPYIISCENPDLLKSIQEALNEKHKGQAVIVVSSNVANDLKAINIGVEFLTDRFIGVRDIERDNLLNKIGILTTITKGERVQSAEVNAKLNEATDYIYTLIDTCNKQFKTYNIPYKVTFNGSMEELYVDNDIDEVENTIDEKGETNDD